MKERVHIITFFLCLCLVGFFANFAQNDYGMPLVHYSLLAISLLFLDLMRISVAKYKVAGYFVFLMVLYQLMPVIVGTNNNAEFAEWIFVLTLFGGFLYNVLILPIALFFKERKYPSHDISFLMYYELLFLSLFTIALYSKYNSMMGASVILTLSMLIVIPGIVRLIRLMKLLLSGEYLTAIFQITVYLFVMLSIVGTTFKFQHWPYADSILYINLPLLFLSFSLWLFMTFRKQNSSMPFSHTSPAVKTAYFSFSITIFWLATHLIGVAPSVYSDRYPKAMQVLGAQANNVTKEGREFGRRYDIYEENLDRFVEEQYKAEQ